VLLARLKAGGHKCLIFTQMSKMLDVLEVGGCAAGGIPHVGAHAVLLVIVIVVVLEAGPAAC